MFRAADAALASLGQSQAWRKQSALAITKKRSETASQVEI